MSKHALGRDLAKVDAHEITLQEYEELPEIDDALIARARRRVSTPARETVSIELDTDFLQCLRATGADWPSRANGALRAWVDESGVWYAHPPSPAWREKVSPRSGDG